MKNFPQNHLNPRPIQLPWKNDCKIFFIGSILVSDDRAPGKVMIHGNAANKLMSHRDAIVGKIRVFRSRDECEQSRNSFVN